MAETRNANYENCQPPPPAHAHTPPLVAWVARHRRERHTGSDMISTTRLVVVGEQRLRALLHGDHSDPVAVPPRHRCLQPLEKALAASTLLELIAQRPAPSKAERTRRCGHQSRRTSPRHPRGKGAPLWAQRRAPNKRVAVWSSRWPRGPLRASVTLSLR